MASVMVRNFDDRRLTFSLRLNFASFPLAAKRASLSCRAFCGGLHGGENSVFGVEGLFELLILLICQYGCFV